MLNGLIKNTAMFQRSFLLLLCAMAPGLLAVAQQAKDQGVHTATVRFDGIDRKYMYYIPSGYDAKARLPIVFFIHGYGASAQIGVDVLGPQFHRRADRDGAIVVYPEATSKHWNDRLGGSFPATDTIDDVAYISHLIDLFINDFKGDPRRVYVSGSSNGGMMTYRLSVDIPGKIAAIAPFISAISPQVAAASVDAEPIPVIITSGTADSVIRWDGGPVDVINTPRLLSGDQNVAYWVARNGTKTSAKVRVLPDIAPDDQSTVEIQHYPGKYDVVLYKIIGGAHRHPTLREPGKPIVAGQNMDYNSFEMVWDFMMRYKK